MAKTITFSVPVSPPSTAYQELTGRKRTRKLMTLATDATTGTNTYAAGGIPLTQTDAGALAAAFDMAHVQELHVLEPLTQASFAGNAHIGKFDLTNFKLVLNTSGGALVAAVASTATTYAIASGTITDSGNGFVTAGFQVGDLLVIAGFTGTAANNTTVIITAVAAGTLTVTPVGAFTNDTAGEPVTLTAYRPAGALREITAGVALGDSKTWTALVEAVGQ